MNSYRIQPEQYDSSIYIDLALIVLGSRNPEAIQALKNFLTILPSPKHIEQVLQTALGQLAEQDLGLYGWMLENRACIEPELDLVGQAKKLATAKLLKLGIHSPLEKRATNWEHSAFSSQILQQLQQVSSPAEWMLLKTLALSEARNLACTASGSGHLDAFDHI